MKNNWIQRFCIIFISLFQKLKMFIIFNFQFSILNSKRLFIRAIMHTDMGCVRRNNEDNAGFRFMGGNKTDFFAILADGMGGYEQGEVASDIMVNTLIDDNGQTMRKDPYRWLADMFSKANSRIYELFVQQQSVMGTTCSMLLIWKKKIFCAHIGDSRIYLLAKGKLKQLTCDHTLVGEMKRKGEITAAEAAVHPQRSILTKAIGTSPKIVPDLFKVSRVRKGDRFLLCSDGLYDLVKDAEIGHLLSQHSLRTAARSLVETAKKHGGYDNITVVIVEINEKTNTDNDEL